jgi:bifunctional NMN adenylyltransferase/nudix hydrolase
MYDYLVYIGRFQPFHNGHLQVVREALKLTKHLIILVGSANSSRNPRNPFTYTERAITIGLSVDDCLKDIPKTHAGKRYSIQPINDYPYNDTGWKTFVQYEVNRVIAGREMRKNGRDKPISYDNISVGIIGFAKDHTSDYLNWFPNWTPEIIPVQFSAHNSSDIRKQYFDPFFRLPTTDHCPQAVVTFLSNFVNDPAFKWVIDYKNQDEKDFKTYGPGPFLCSDAIVVQNGHILLVTRGKHPGKGQLALPGGHLDPKETLRDCAVRELKEETDIRDNKGRIPPGRLISFIDKRKTKVYDHPERSTGPRKVTEAFYFELPETKGDLYDVLGQDDAERATWYPLGSLRTSDFFADHAHIIMDQLNIVMKD